MSLPSVIFLRLFSTGKHPGLSLVWRALAFGIVLVGLSIATYRATPMLVLGHGNTNIFRALCAALIVCVGNSALFILLHGHYIAGAKRLRLLWFMPLSATQYKLAYALAGLPIVVLALGVSAASAERMTHSNVLVVVLAEVLSMATLLLLRVMQARWKLFPQAMSLGLLVSGAVLLKALLAHGPIGANQYLPALYVLAGLHGAIAIYASKQQPLQLVSSERGEVTERRVGLLGAFGLRALRTRRYLAALGLLGAVLVGSLIAVKRGAMPMDAAAVLVVLLMGTLAHEARSLSRRCYPLEAVHFGALARMLQATWLITALAAALCVGGLLLAAKLWFGGQLGVTPLYVIAFGASVVALAVLAASVVVPQASDIVAQLLSAAVYGVLVWLLFKVFRGADDTAVLVRAAAICVSSLASAYYVEKRRWLVTIRGTHGALL